jgi:hypothetical protein
MSLPQPKRPLSLILFAVWIAILGGISLGRSILLLQQIAMSVDPSLEANRTVAILGILWGVGLLAGAVGLWLRWQPARWIVLLLVPIYYLTQWLHTVLTTRASYGQGRILPYTVLALLAIAYSTWFLLQDRGLFAHRYAWRSDFSFSSVSSHTDSSSARETGGGWR